MQEVMVAWCIVRIVAIGPLSALAIEGFKTSTHWRPVSDPWILSKATL